MKSQQCTETRILQILKQYEVGRDAMDDGAITEYQSNIIQRA